MMICQAPIGGKHFLLVDISASEPAPLTAPLSSLVHTPSKDSDHHSLSFSSHLPHDQLLTISQN